MTDKKTEIPQASPAATSASSAPSGQAGGAAASKTAGPAGSTPTPKSPGPATSPAAPPAPPARRKSRSPLLPAFLVALLIVAALAAVVWYQQKQFEQNQANLAGQVQDSTLAVRQAADQAQQALALSQEQSRQIATLENALREFRGQIDGLDQAFQTLTDSSSDLVLINDVDHLVTIAQQQLQLGGNVANAVISLETAQAQLARANRPGLASLQQTLNGDLDRLRAASTIDIALLSTQLDELSGLISQAALLVPDDAAPEPTPAPQPESAAAASSTPDSAADPDAPWWKQGLATAESWSRTAWDSVQRDLGQFITVRRVDDATALLMSPDQATRFRETLRLRIMTAQLALMMRQPKVWEAETDSLVKSIETRFDERSPQTRQALKIARHMADTSIDVKLPTVANTLQSIETLREEQARHAGQGQDAAPAAETEPAEAPRAEEPASAPEADPSADDAAPAASAAAGSTTTVGS
ncbi:uroporphyrinogen-III C-methyltransferase [Pusillimonas sp. SM2304]|uniref:uroporphyrinogen-III C-methyltransferase n=1 Tax=Pusillimonas sp. SM2304 TaxID=3073241 RepID=UPI00287447A7|nr:uroporphyrinogen-III C-methyltransferase [Pusillimonas sp. SM2304]MDS1141820.1 uroporphyrinogen-III C-methyltransferase [Pusillimonas sp. SM2304]